MSTDFSELFELEVAEKLQLVEDLWDNIATTPDAVPVEDWQKEELARRKAAHQQDQEAGSSWEDVKARIRQSNDD
ncbi:MAG: addiction module protein [Planctomycetes bacterium]|nr:addiction module protein [Planctomycetota bacterium]